MNFKNMTTKEREKNLWKPILKVLQDAGGKLSRSEIKSRLCDLDEGIAIYAQDIRTSENGRQYKPFDWNFNFAVKQLSFLGYLVYQKGSAIALTDDGLNIDVNKINPDDYTATLEKAFKKTKDNKKATVVDDEDSQDEDSKEENLVDDFKTQLALAISKMSPKKFEAFSRLLLTKMGVDFTEKGIQVTNDGGIDGYGYHIDLHDFRTTRVVIQCKRYNSGSVGEPEINQFLGAMNKFQADYGVFITNGRFTSSARTAAREGSPITLIDGNDLIELVIKYELHVTPVTTYIMDNFYDD